MDEVRRCTECGSSNPVDARFCSTCAASLAPPATGPTSYLAGAVCPTCGADAPAGAQFCQSCGQRLAAEPGPRAQPEPQTYAAQRPAAKTMACPVCREVVLVITERQGIEVDYCPQCRGVWLDRGELDKIIERVAVTQGTTDRYPPQPQAYQPRAYRERRDDDDDDRRRKKRRGFLDDLFDFD